MQRHRPPPKLGTAVVGAGPAGLLFAALARHRWEQAGLNPETWKLGVYDKRAEYSRTHRLRLDPKPYGALVALADDPRFDAFGAFLVGEAYRPNIAELETELQSLAAAYGVAKEVVHVGGEPGQLPLSALKARVLGDDVAAPFTIVGADSVHSTVRAAAQLRPSRAVTHEYLARLVVRGPGLPRRLGALDTYRISKVVASIFEYRWRDSESAAVDLFLSERAYDALAALGASPRHPVRVDRRVVTTLADPLLRRFVGFLTEGFGEGSCTIELHSVFRLEHAIAGTRAMRPAGLDAAVFLVGDAAVSLPFQRGMACLARSAVALADAHVALASGAGDEALVEYDHAVGVIAEDELRVVRARAGLVSGLRQFVRISAMLPFPIQNWFLSVDATERAVGRLTPGLALNGLVAAATAAVSLGGPLTSMSGPTLTLTPAVGIVLGCAGGIVYRATLTFEPVANAWVRGIWRWTILGLLVGGVGLAATTSALDARPRQLGMLVLWWLVGLAFAIGIAVFEWIGRRGFTQGRLDGDS